MSNYLRLKIPGGTYFFTLVTYLRRPFLTTSICRSILRAAWLDVSNRFPFETIAVCLLPDHIHCIWSLPEGDPDFSMRWREIKRLFTKEYQSSIRTSGERSDSRVERAEAAIWQRRFWEHLIRGEDDLHSHLDYIHYNPVKHGLVKSAADWPWSSFQRYVKLGYYDARWGEGVGKIFGDVDFGE